MSSFGWVDFSSEDRVRMRHVLAAVKDQGTLDELGIGQLRDAYSDLLFPGFSTVQTNARYFLEVPKILRDWADENPAARRRTPLLEYLRIKEDALAALLVRSYEVLEREPEGVIGHTRVDKGGVLRRPSSSYWGGLRVFGIVRSKLSLEEFCREWGSGDSNARVSAEDGSDDEEYSRQEVSRPPESQGPRQPGLTLALTRAEAIFLAKRFESGGDPDRAVASQLLRSKQTKRPIQCEQFEEFAVWARANARLNAHCRSLVETASRFSLFIEGAHIVFNRIMASRLEHKPLARAVSQRWTEWNQRCASEKVFGRDAVAEWTGVLALGQTRPRLKCEAFLGRWNKAILDGWTLSKLERLIEDRAMETKGDRSLLRRSTGIPANGDWFGMGALDYRWKTARRMLRDIHEGLAS